MLSYSATMRYLAVVLALVVVAIGLLVLRNPASFKITIGLGLIPIVGILAAMWTKRREVDLNSEAIAPDSN